ncbi:hypothetical protein MMC12_002953 [Toensbergia leucococca]|nr:hypothetical protein [Toensbergia leucococca]
MFIPDTAEGNPDAAKPERPKSRNESHPPDETVSGRSTRSHYVNKPDELVKAFPVEYVKNATVYVIGGRAKGGPFQIDEVLGGGQYKLKDPITGEKRARIYQEASLTTNAN